MIGTSDSVLAPSLPWQFAQVSANFSTSAARTPLASDKPNKALHANKTNPVAFFIMALFSNFLITRLAGVFPLLPIPAWG
jgi:hypothetical protein